MQKSKKYKRTYGFLVFFLFCAFFSTNFLLSQKGPIANDTFTKISIQKSPEYVDFLYKRTRQFVRSNADSAIHLGNRILKISNEIGYEIGIAKAKETIARTSMHKAADSLSFALAIDAFNYSKEVGADSVFLETINVLGFGNYRNKRIDKVFEYNSMGRRYATKFGNWEKSYLFTTNAASIMADLNEYERAVSFYKLSLSLLKEKPDIFKSAELNIEIAKMYYGKNELDKTIEFLEYAQKQINHIKDKFLQNSVWIIKSNVFLKKNNIEGAKELLEKADNISKGSNDYQQLVELNLAEANLEFNLENYENAYIIVTNTIPIAERLHFLRAQEALIKLSYDIKQKMGEFELANDLLETYHQLRDSIKYEKNQNTTRIALAENNYRQQQQLLNLKLEKGSAVQKAILIIALIVVLSLLSILFLVKKNESKLKLLNHELTETQVQLQNKTERLDDANTTKVKLFSIIGHDFKGPIGGIKSLLDLLVEKGITKEEFDNYLPLMKTRVDNVLFSLNNLFLWGEAQLNGRQTKPINFDLITKIDNSIALLASRIDNKKIQVKNQVEINTKVWADEDHIEIVLRNLLSNALKFTPQKGTIIFGAEKTESNWKIWIKDSGIGMSNEIKNKVFHSNERVTNYGTDNEKGTGLGVSICIEMIKENQGRIWVDSELNKGTTIYFTLPQCKEI